MHLPPTLPKQIPSSKELLTPKPDLQLVEQNGQMVLQVKMSPANKRVEVQNNGDAILLHFPDLVGVNSQEVGVLISRPIDKIEILGHKDGVDTIIVHSLESDSKKPKLYIDGQGGGDIVQVHLDNKPQVRTGKWRVKSNKQGHRPDQVIIQGKNGAAQIDIPRAYGSGPLGSFEPQDLTHPLVFHQVTDGKPYTRVMNHFDLKNAATTGDKHLELKFEDSKLLSIEDIE